VEVKLLNSTPIDICAIGISKCHDKNINEYTHEDKLDLIDRVGNKLRHESVLEHLVISLDIVGISRALLQELVRTRIASYTVKSSRYTLKELSKEDVFNIDDNRWKKYLYVSDDIRINNININTLNILKELLDNNVSNDIAKYVMPEAYLTSLTMTINIRSLRNLLALRTGKGALLEYKKLCIKIYNVLPEDYKSLVIDVMNKEVFSLPE